MVSISGKTHIGRRKANEDRIVADSDWGLALVADGMGGAGSGDIASQIVASTITERLGEGDSLEQAVTRAHEAVMAAAASGQGNRGMGSTIVVARFDGADYEIAWIGDSRAYLFDGESLMQLTRDHSQLEYLLSIGELKPEDADDYPAKNVITRAMGIPWSAGERVPSLSGTLARHHTLLLCSDGLNDAAGDARVLQLLKQNDADNLLQQLIDAALDAGGSDNISVVLCKPGKDAPQTGRLPPVVAIVKGDMQREYFPADVDSKPAREIETTQIRMVQPGAVEATSTALDEQNDSGSSRKIAGVLLAIISAGAIATALHYFNIF